MGYHEAFWMTLGTVAPVISLTHLVALGRNRGLIARGERELWVRSKDSPEQLRTETESAARLSTRLREQSDSLKRATSDRVLTPEEREGSEDKQRALDTEVKSLNASVLATGALHERMPAQFPRAAGWAKLSDAITALSWTACLAALALALFSLAIGP